MGILTTGELEQICKSINREYGSDTPVCIQIRNDDYDLLHSSYVLDYTTNQNGVLYLTNVSHKKGEIND